MKTHLKIPIVCLQLLLALGLLFGTQTTVKADQIDEGTAAYLAGNYQKALGLLKPLAEQGNANAQFWIGEMYDKGQGVPQDYAEGIKWYRKAAEQGDKLSIIAQHYLGNSYAIGQGVPQDYAEAAKWYRKAAEQGFFHAQFNLGAMYGHGQGVPQDYVLAHKWFNLSASLSKGKTHENAVNNRNIAENKMTPAQVAEAQKLAREWKPKTWEELSQQN